MTGQPRTLLSWTAMAMLQTQELGLAGFGNADCGPRTILDPAVQAYDEPLISTYCPDQLEAYEAELGKARTEQTIP